MAKQPFEALRSIKPAHKLGAPLLNSDELRDNRKMGQQAQAQATVHPLQPGLTGKGIGRQGRKGRTR